MNPPVPVRRGVRALRWLLREQSFDVRELDLAGFQRWLQGHLGRWRRDPVFTQRSAVRDQRRAHPELRALERERRRAAAADAASPPAREFARLERDLHNAGRAVAGLEAALGRSPPDGQGRLREKLEAQRRRHRELSEALAALVRSSPERRALLDVEARLRGVRAATGLDRAEGELAGLLRRKGQRSGASGTSFERTAVAVAESHILPEVVRGARPDPRVRLLRSVTLGAARTEFDLLIVRVPRGGPGLVEVLAAVEAKRNPNDLAHGYRQRLENLAWLTGDASGYDPALYRTARFRSGHFDREAVHSEGGEGFAFTAESFRRLRPGPDVTPPRLYFVTRAGPLWGLSAAALSRVAHRVATDERWDLDDEGYLGGLLTWCRSLAGAFETPDLLRRYADDQRAAHRILIVDC